QQSRARTYDVADALCQADTGGYFHRATDLVDFGVDVVFLQIIAENFGIGGGNIFSLKIGYARIILTTGYCQRKPTFGESQFFQHRSEEHTSELQSRENLVCRLLLEN